MLRPIHKHTKDPCQACLKIFSIFLAALKFKLLTFKILQMLSVTTQETDRAEIFGLTYLESVAIWRNFTSLFLLCWNHSIRQAYRKIPVRTHLHTTMHFSRFKTWPGDLVASSDG